MKILYFAWVREKIGLDEEELAPPCGVTTVADLLDWLRGRSKAHAAALAEAEALHVAVDQEFADPTTPVSTAAEVAIFPPVTGGRG